MDLGVCDRASEHPEAAVRMHVCDALSATEHCRCGLDALRHFVWRFDHGGLDVDDPDSQTQLRTDVAQPLEVAISGTRQLEDDVVRMDPLEESDELDPVARLDPLTPIVAEAE